jgi:hypothetical protein
MSDANRPRDKTEKSINLLLDGIESPFNRKL